MSTELWSNILTKLKEKISKPSYETWLTNTTAEINGDVITVKSSNDFARDWLESRYKTIILETVQELTKQINDIEFVSNDNQVKYVQVTHHEYIDLHEKMKSIEKRVEKLEKKLNEGNA